MLRSDRGSAIPEPTTNYCTVKGFTGITPEYITPPEDTTILGKVRSPLFSS